MGGLDAEYFAGRCHHRRQDKEVEWGLLSHTGLPISEIAATCEFGTRSSFSRSFHRYFGQMPREYQATGPAGN